MTEEKLYNAYDIHHALLRIDVIKSQIINPIQANLGEDSLLNNKCFPSVKQVLEKAISDIKSAFDVDAEALKKLFDAL